MCDKPSVYSNQLRTARKEHICIECRRPIKPGERYHLFKGCWDGSWSRYKTCEACEDLRSEIMSECDYRLDEGIPFGDLHEHAREADYLFPPEKDEPAVEG
jgi:hypothetical protein